MDRVRRWMMLLSFVLAVLVVLPVRAATRQPVSLEYVDKYFTSCIESTYSLWSVSVNSLGNTYFMHIPL